MRTYERNIIINNNSDLNQLATEPLTAAVQSPNVEPIGVLTKVVDRSHRLTDDGPNIKSQSTMNRGERLLSETEHQSNLDGLSPDVILGQPKYLKHDASIDPRDLVTIPTDIGESNKPIAETDSVEDL